MRGRILVIDHATPTPDQDSGSASTFGFLNVLVKAGFTVTFAPATLRHDRRYTDALNACGIATLAAPRFTSLASVIEELAARADVLLLYRVQIAAPLLKVARRTAPATRILFHPVDLHFLRLERGAQLSGEEAERREAFAIREIELGLIRDADAVVVVSEHERDLLRTLAPEAAVHYVPILRPIPPQPIRLFGWRMPFGRLPLIAGVLSCDRPPFDRRRDIVFIGGYSHRPNVDAMLWFCAEVWPHVLRRGFPGRLVIAGSNTPPQIAALASETIAVVGQVDDLEQLFDGCRLSIAPLRYGGGIKGKIVSSLSYGAPVVATSIAAEGMGLRDGRDILVGDGPEQMAEAICTLYGDRALWNRLSRNGYRAFLERFSEDVLAGRICALFDELVAAKR